MEDNLKEIKSNIESSNEVLRVAWERHAPQMSGKMYEIGKPVSDSFLRRQWAKSKDVRKTNILKRFKQFLAGSYLTRKQSGEVIFSDLSYFRFLFFYSPISEIQLEQSFFKVNDLWFQAQQAFFARDMVRFSKILISLTQELFNLRRIVSLLNRSNHSTSAKSLITRFIDKFRGR